MSTYLAILQSVCERVRQLNLPEIPDSQVAVAKVFVPEVIETLPGLPAAVVHVPGRAEVAQFGGTNERDDIGYPVQISLLAQDDQQNDETVRFARHAHWQERLRQGLVQRALPVPGVFTSRLESQKFVEPLPWKRRNLWVGSLVVRFLCREARLP